MKRDLSFFLNKNVKVTLKGGKVIQGKLVKQGDYLKVGNTYILTPSVVTVIEVLDGESDNN